MSIPKTWEEERRVRLEQLLEEEPDTPERFGPGSYGMHELLDRAHLASRFFQEHVLEHPACLLSEELWREASTIVDLMERFYQKIGELSAAEEEEKAEA
jgi:hypothetical protein